MVTDPNYVREISEALQKGEPVDLNHTLIATEATLRKLRGRLDRFHARADKVRTTGFYKKKELREIEEALEEGQALRKLLLEAKKRLAAGDNSGAGWEVAAERTGIPPSSPPAAVHEVFGSTGRSIMDLGLSRIEVKIMVDPKYELTSR